MKKQTGALLIFILVVIYGKDKKVTGWKQETYL